MAGNIPFDIKDLRKTFPFGMAGKSLSNNDKSCAESIPNIMQQVASEHIAEALMLKPVDYKDNLWAYELAYGAVIVSMNVLNDIVQELILTEDEETRMIFYTKLATYSTLMNNQAEFFRLDILQILENLK